MHAFIQNLAWLCALIAVASLGGYAVKGTIKAARTAKEYFAKH